jgi:isoquinoline 1-oxidoreductase beta subunit
LHQHFLGGGYGRRGQHEVILDAVRLAKAVGNPVKLIWTREDDLTGGKFRPMTLTEMGPSDEVRFSRLACSVCHYE